MIGAKVDELPEAVVVIVVVVILERPEAATIANRPTKTKTTTIAILAMRCNAPPARPGRFPLSIVVS